MWLHRWAPMRQVSNSERMKSLSRRALGHSVLRLGAAGIVAAGWPPSTSALGADLKESGTVTIEQVQIAFIGSGNLGGGKLHYSGRTYDFTVGGLGIGGFGVSKMTATGAVYNLKGVNDFPGTYGQARYGAVVGTKNTRALWWEKRRGVVLELKAAREGLALSLGADAVYIKFDD